MSNYVEKRYKILSDIEKVASEHKMCPAGDGEMIASDVAKLSQLNSDLVKLTLSYMWGETEN